MKKIIVVAGLGDNKLELTIASNWWKKEGLEPIIFLPRWENKKGVKPKLARLLKMIDKESSKDKIFLIGISAGASLAMNAFLKRLGKVEKMVSVCGRLKMGWSDNEISKKLQKNTLTRRAFKESVKLLEDKIKDLKEEDKKRIMTVSAEYGDELIPIQTSKIDGADNITIPTIGHLITITSAMTNNFGPIKKFLLGKE